MANIYQHTLRYSDLANPRPMFQSHLEIVGADPNLNRLTKRYYSSTDVSIYFGDFFIDDASYIDFEVTESAMLLYGYNSYVFDDVAKGARMVQGRFAINFTQANYLSKVMSDLSVHKGTGAITHSKYHALWPTGFDLFVHHGSTDSKDLELIMLQDVYITGVSSQADPRTGEPIREIYTFIGKDVKFGAELETDDNTTSEPEPETEITEEQEYNKPDIKISHYSNEISVTFDQKVSIKKATYYFDSGMPTAQHTQIHSTGFIITPTSEQTKLWDEAMVYLKIFVTFSGESSPREYDKVLIRK